MIKLGMIGYNEGNGHPYSFSAIINGYNEAASSECPYPGINTYLKARKKEEFGVENLKVTHVWTPFKKISEGIASYAFIENVTETYEEMIESIDAVIIARDDAECHREIAAPFLMSGKKVFIDKPLCKNSDDLEFFIPYLESGQAMSCSGLRFYPKIGELAPLADSILFAHCVAPLDWFKYGIHALEGVIPLFEGSVQEVQSIGSGDNDVVKVTFANDKFIVIQVSKHVAGGIRSTLYFSQSDPVHIHFNDNFTCFKRQLIAFSELLSTGTKRIDPNETVLLIRTLIAAQLSKSQKWPISM